MRKLQTGHASLVIVLLSTLFLTPINASNLSGDEDDITVVKASHSCPIPISKPLGKGSSDGSDNESTPGTSLASTALHTPPLLSDDEGGDRGLPAQLGKDKATPASPPNITEIAAALEILRSDLPAEIVAAIKARHSGLGRKGGSADTVGPGGAGALEAKEERGKDGSITITTGSSTRPVTYTIGKPMARLWVCG
jgi:hypothetical protein